MSERIDHAAEARFQLEGAQDLEAPFCWGAFAAAQVHATLALVEQQRIANLVSLAKLAGDESVHEELQHIAYQALGVLVEYKQTSLDDEHPVVPENIARALRIGDGNE